MKTIALKSDQDIQHDVLAELKYEPSVNIADIGVTVSSGVVTLNGYATNYVEKVNAVKAARRVAGVKAIADDIEVRFPGSMPPVDGNIAAAAVEQIARFTNLPVGEIEVTVTHGCITLTGTVEWWYQSKNAESAVKHLSGVKSVRNNIVIKPRLKAGDIKKNISDAFQRSALFDSQKIEVVIVGNTVELRGTVRNHSERDEAERAAWAAPGVHFVLNLLDLETPWLDN